jgi:hypothetical protein
MTQLIETEPRYECITDDTVPCNNILIHPGMPATDEELLAFAFSNEFPPLSAVPLPAGGVLLITALVGAAVWRRLAR